jgi:putative ABC transport system ATP-binding protein
MAPDESRPLLEGRGLTRTYHLGLTAVPALTAVDIAIHRGDFLVLQGPSGSGKTTLINLLGLLDAPDGGTVHLDGRPVSGADVGDDRLADLRRDRFGFVFQTFNLVPVLSAAENVEYPMMLKGMPRADRSRRARELLDAVGLRGKEDVRPDLLSGGERQRVVMARALANAPDVVFADEPTANLDTASANGILDLMTRLNTEHGTAFVVATHDPRVAARARRALTLRDGRLVEAA